MDLTIGKALREARLKKGLSPAEVAKATLIRADWITDLENEDYHRFPSLSYARNFQILYAKFLEVDMQKAAMIDPGKVVLTTSFDHVYDGISPVGYRGTARPKPIRRSRWIAAIAIFGVASVIGAITALFILDILRLPSWEEMTGDGPAAEERLVVPPSTALPIEDESIRPAPRPTPSEELPPFAEDGTMHPPTAPPPPRFELTPPPAEWQKLLPTESAKPEPPPASTGAGWVEPAFPFASDAEALATPFPSESSGPHSPDEADTTPAGREPAGTPAAPPATPALP